MKLNKGSLLTVAVLCLSVLFSSCSVASVETKLYKTPEEYSISEDFTVADTGDYSLDFIEDMASVVLRNKEGEIVWSTSPIESYEERLDEYGDPIPLHSKVKSAIIIEYIEPGTSKISTAYSFKECAGTGSYSVKEIADGIEITYYFDEIKISVPVEFTFKDNVVRISVEPSRITEGEYRLYSIAVAPYSCGIYNLSQNGYLFVPSGSGAIIEPCQLEEGSLTYSRELYGDDATRYRERELDTEKYPENRLAIFGAKIYDDSAICAIIEKGAEHAFIEAETGAVNTGYSSVWAKFALRAYQWSKIRNEQQVKLYSKSMSQDTVTVAYRLLSGENADYVGMADTYREYLISKYGMKPQNADSLLNLKIVGGANITETFLGFKYDKFFSATTLDQAENMISEVKPLVDGKITADLIGFGKSGIDVKTIAGGYTVNSDLGGEKALKTLADYAKENDCKLFFNADVLGLSKSGSGVSKASDTALSQDKRKIKQYYYNLYLRKKTTEHTPYLLVARKLIPDITEKLAVSFSDIGIHGFGLDTLSTVCYSDYTDSKYFSKGNMANDVGQAIKSIKEKGYAVAVNEANDYAAANADIIYDLPLTSSKNNIFSFDVPFYSIVFKGYIPLSVESLNLTSNADNMLLKAAEVGAGLSYTLVNNGSTKLFDSFSSVFYGSVFEDIKPLIEKDIEKYQNDFKLIENAKISNHSILENGLHKTEFDNDVTVYTNFAQNALSVNGRTVESGSYLFVRE
ncbi:MAG: hypothetical protein IKD04_04150 [Clostridia bacterium]|nr:hypothetical protein [Clostridia bacterium]